MAAPHSTHLSNAPGFRIADEVYRLTRQDEIGYATAATAIALGAVGAVFGLHGFSTGSPVSSLWGAAAVAGSWAIPPLVRKAAKLNR